VTDRQEAVAGILLAAGEGRRFGGVKALARVDGRLLVEHTLAMLRDGGCEPVVVVLGAAAGDVRRTADLDGGHVVVAERWREGQSESLRAGLAAATGSAAAVVALVDQPWIGAAAVHRLIEEWRAGATVVVATYDGAPRNPVLFDASTWAELSAALTGDEGGRSWLRAHPELVAAVDCSDTGDPRDVDVPEDLSP
jgi:nicotine blue oxidoreductase